jgi:transposase-like protein
MKTPNLTEEQGVRIVEMRERGMSCGAIARIVGISAGAVSWHCLKEGADPPGLAAKVIDTTIRGPEIVMRSGFPVRRFTPEDDRTLLALEASGLNYSEIARRLGRQPNSIRGRLYTLARHEARRDAAEERSQAHNGDHHHAAS